VTDSFACTTDRGLLIRPRALTTATVAAANHTR
jgi:hypothetical protein